MTSFSIFFFVSILFTFCFTVSVCVRWGEVSVGRSVGRSVSACRLRSFRHAWLSRHALYMALTLTHSLSLLQSVVKWNKTNKQTMSNIRTKKKKEKKNVHGMARVHGRTNSVALNSFFVKTKQSVGLFSPLLSNFQKKTIRTFENLAKLQHAVFPRGPPPQYWLRQHQLNFGDRTGSGAFWCVWP